MDRIIILSVLVLITIPGCSGFSGVSEPSTPNEVTPANIPTTNTPQDMSGGYLHIKKPESVPENATVVNYERLESEIILEGIQTIGESNESKYNLTQEQYDQARQEISKYDYYGAKNSEYESGWYIKYKDTVYYVNVVGYMRLV